MLDKSSPFAWAVKFFELPRFVFRASSSAAARLEDYLGRSPDLSAPPPARCPIPVHRSLKMKPAEHRIEPHLPLNRLLPKTPGSQHPCPARCKLDQLEETCWRRPRSQSSRTHDRPALRLRRPPRPACHLHPSLASPAPPLSTTAELYHSSPANPEASAVAPPAPSAPHHFLRFAQVPPPVQDRCGGACLCHHVAAMGHWRCCRGSPAPNQLGQRRLATASVAAKTCKVVDDLLRSLTRKPDVKQGAGD